MKNLLILLAISILFAACGASPNQGEQQDLEGLKSTLIAKEKQISQLKTEMDSIKVQIEMLDPEFGKKEIPFVELIQLSKVEFNHYVEVQGTIEADEERMISSEMPGKITSLRVKEGDNVSRGKLIATIDTESIEKGIEELKKSMELANDLFERQERLWQKNIGSEIQYLQAKNNKERLEKSLVSAELSLKKARIYAPISGTITMVLGKQGEITSPGVPIVKLISTRKVKLTADVPETYIRDVKRNDYVSVKVPVLDLEQKSRVSRIGSEINNNNRTFEVEVKLDNSKRELKPNLLAMLMINDYSAKDAVAIPLEIVQQDVSGNNFVFAAEQKEGKYFVVKKMIETGVAFNGDIEIISGLTGEEMLVTTGAQYLADGQEIAVKS